MMEELVKAIEKLSEKDAVDYLLIIVPILISLVAIFISVAIAIRQNKIAMFELRYRALATIMKVISFGITFNYTNNPRVILESFNSCFSTSISSVDKVAALVDIRRNLDNMEEKVAVISDILKPEDKKILKKAFAKLSSIMEDVVTGNVDATEIEDFKVLCILLEQITAKKLSKKILGSNWCFDYSDPLQEEHVMLDRKEIKRAKKQINGIIKEESKRKI